MILSISYQFKIFLMSLFIGLILGIFYDFIKIFRKYIVHNNIIINIEDAIYWLFMSIIIFLISLYQNDGYIRAFFILGIFIGMIFYTLLISKFFINLTINIISIFIKIIRFILKILYAPFLLILKIILIPLKYLFNVFKKFLLKYKFCVKIYNRIFNTKVYFKNFIRGDKLTNEKSKK